MDIFKFKSTKKKEEKETEKSKNCATWLAHTHATGVLRCRAAD
jgi:hypothetical protein